tara:strand:+ start:2064 stop:2186 length:123 start_codon:yes stop_codon:yes gene_type:complete
MTKEQIDEIIEILELQEIRENKNWDDFIAYCREQEHCNHE